MAASAPKIEFIVSFQIHAMLHFRLSEIPLDRTPNHWALSAHLVPRRGAFRAIVTTRGAGCDGRCRIGRFLSASRSMRAAGGQVVWSWHPWAGAKCVTSMTPRATVTNKVMDTGESSKQPSNPLRRECRCSASPVVTTLVCFSHLRTGLWVRPAPGIPCALSLFSRAGFSIARARDVPRDCGRLPTSLRGAQATKQSRLLASLDLWIASLRSQ